MEDLTASYNVTRTFRGASLYRPALDNTGGTWKPEFSAHLESDEQAKQTMNGWQSGYFASFGQLAVNDLSASSSYESSSEDTQEDAQKDGDEEGYASFEGDDDEEEMEYGSFGDDDEDWEDVSQ